MEILKIGDQSPTFEGLDQNNKAVSSNDFNGSKWVIYFYPKDNTPGCTAQACSLRDGFDELSKNNRLMRLMSFSERHES